MATSSVHGTRANEYSKPGSRGPPNIPNADSTDASVPETSISRLSPTAYTAASRSRSAGSSRRRYAVQPSTAAETSASRADQRQSVPAACGSKKEYSVTSRGSDSQSGTPSITKELPARKVAPEPTPSSSRPRLGRKATAAPVRSPSARTATTTKPAAADSATETVSARPAARPATAQPRTARLRQAAQRSASVPCTAKASRPASRAVHPTASHQPAEEL